MFKPSVVDAYLATSNEIFGDVSVAGGGKP